MIKIAVVDDDITTRSLIKMLLEMEGYQVANPSNENTDFIQIIRQQEIDLLFIDVHLQNQSGIEIVRKIRESHHLPNLKILMTSGMDVGDQCISVGANGFLLKPFMPNELLGWIKSNINKE